jgi:hypothetical protein
MYPSQSVVDPVAMRLREREAGWERERIAKLWYMLCDGKITPAEAKERGL